MKPIKLFLALSATHCVQRMQYYPSGLPWSDVMGTSEQPYKYNGKEFIEMLGKFIGKPEWKPDTTGTNLELPHGTPYSYAPSYIILPL